MRPALTALLVGSMLLLAGCGADGPPRAPSPEPGVSIQGEARIGVVTTL